MLKKNRLTKFRVFLLCVCVAFLLSICCFIFDYIRWNHAAEPQARRYDLLCGSSESVLCVGPVHIFALKIPLNFFDLPIRG